MRPDQPPAEERLPYEKPWVQVIPLKPSQLLGGNCKLLTGLAGLLAGNEACASGQCVSIGS